MCGVVFAMWFVRDTLPREIPPLLVVDGFAALFTGLIIFSVLVLGLLSYIYFEEREENPKEYYILFFLATLGSSRVNHQPAFCFVIYRARIAERKPVCIDRLFA